ncbi:MAG: urease accessory protein UreD [Acuticoccus sp.]
MNALAQPVARYQRSDGRIEIVVAERGGRASLRRAYQAGSGKVRLLRPATDAVEALVLNTAGGLAGGDRFHLSAAVTGRPLILSTQASERVYRAEGGRARVEQHLSVGAGGRLVHAPQPTILFNDASLARRTRIDIAGDGALTFVEGLVMGRAAMGETVRSVDLADRTDLRIDGRLAFVDALRLGTAQLADMAMPAMLGGHRAAGLVLHRDGDLAAARDKLLAVLPETAGASLVGGVMVARILAPTHGALQDSLARALTALTGAPPPRSWQI